MAPQHVSLRSLRSLRRASPAPLDDWIGCSAGRVAPLKTTPRLTRITRSAPRPTYGNVRECFDPRERLTVERPNTMWLVRRNVSYCPLGLFSHTQAYPAMQAG